MRQKAFNQHFFKMIISFILVIVFVMTFISFIEDATSKGKVANNNDNKKSQEANFDKSKIQYNDNKGS